MQHGIAPPSPSPVRKRASQQRGVRIGQRRGQRENAEAQGAADQHALAPEAVGNRPEPEGAERQPGQRGAEYAAHAGRRNMQQLGDGRRSQPDDLQVEAIEQRDESAQDDDADLESANRPRADQLGDIDGCRATHPRSRRQSSGRASPGTGAWKAFSIMATSV